MRRYGQTHSRLLVCLPGIDDLADDYQARGFVGAATAAGLDMDLITVDAHYGYYARRSVIERLRTDVIAPARQAGSGPVWLLGISLGGFGALLYAQAHPEDVAGLVLLAPFLGTGAMVKRLQRAGGVHQWQHQAIAEDDHEGRLWRWLRGYATEASRPPLYLGFGNRDRFAPAHRLLASLLPPDNAVCVPGGHDWRTWRQIWTRFLATGFLSASRHPLARATAP